MTQYKDATLDELEKLATDSSAEIGAFGDTIFDYLTGHRSTVCDAETALFLASARATVLELIRRLREKEQLALDSAAAQQSASASLLWTALTDLQRKIILSARLNYATIGDWQQDELKEARRLQAQGYVTLELLERHGHAYEVNLTLKARELLAAAKI